MSRSLVQDTPPLGGDEREGQRVAMYKESRIDFESAVEFGAYIRSVYLSLIESMDHIILGCIRVVMGIPDGDDMAILTNTKAISSVQGSVVQQIYLEAHLIYLQPADQNFTGPRGKTGIHKIRRASPHLSIVQL